MERTPSQLPRLNLWDWPRWIPPALPALCGVLSTVYRPAGFSLTPANLTRLAFFLLLVEGSWRLFWNAVAAYDWGAALRSLGVITGEADTPREMLRRLFALVDSEDAAPLSAHAALAALSLALLLILPAALGPAFAAYSLIVLAAALWVRRIGRTSAIVETILFALGPWWVGAWAWGGLSLLSLGLSLAFAVCAWSGLTTNEWLWFYRAGLGAALVILILAGRPFAAGAIGVLFVAALARASDPRVHFRVQRLPLMASMLIAALAVVWASP